MADKKELTARVAALANQMAVMVHQCVPCNDTEYGYSDTDDRAIYAECKISVKGSGRVLSIKVLVCHENATASLHLDDAMVIENKVSKSLTDVRLDDLLWGEACVHLLDTMCDRKWSEFLKKMASELANPHYKLPRLVKGDS